MNMTRAFAMKRTQAKILLFTLLLSIIAAFPFYANAASGGTGFRVSGSIILGPDGKEFIARGININGMNWVWSREVTQDADLMTKTWKFNAVRVNCFEKKANGQYTANNNLDKIISTFTRKKVVTMLEVHDFIGTYPKNPAEQGRPSLTEFLNWWKTTAAKYKNNPYVWFNLMNEPGNSDLSSEWKTVNEKAIGVIRSTAPNNIIVCDGATWGQDAGKTEGDNVKAVDSAILTYGPAIKAKYKNIVFSVHMYDKWNYPAAKFENFVSQVKAKGLPLIIGEFGVWVNQARPYYDTVKSAISVSAKNKIGWFAWQWDGGDENDLTTSGQGGAWEIDKKDGTKPGNLTWYGDKIWDMAHGVVPGFSKTDLAVTKVLIDYPRFEAGEQISLQAFVKNNGDSDLKDKKLIVDFYVDNKKVSQASWQGDIEMEKSVSVFSKPFTAGKTKMNVKAVISTKDSNYGKDGNAFNNSKELAFDSKPVAKRADLIVTKLELDKDLDQIEEGNTVKFIARVKNQGGKATPKEALGGSFYVDGNPFTWDSVTTSLAADDSLILTGKGSYKAEKSFDLTFVLDSKSYASEGNRTIALRVTVKKSSEPVNIVSNSGFESGDSGWSDWGSREIQDKLAHSGSKAFHVSSEALGGGHGGGGQDLVLKPNTTYIVGAWGKNDVAPESGKPSDVGVQFTAAGDKAQTKYFMHFTETEWTYKQTIFTTPASLSGGSFFIWKSGEIANFYVDDVMVKEIPNLASNGGFENGETGWSDWGSREVQDKMVHTGKKAWHIISAKAGGGHGGGGQDLSLKPNTTYVLGVWGKHDVQPSASTDAGVQYTAAGDKAQTKHFIHFTETEWTFKSVVFTTPENFTGANLFSWKQDEDSNFYMDDVVLTAVPNALSNGGFENGDTGWSDWGSREVQETVVHSGKKAWRVKSAAAGGGHGGGGYDLALKPNTTYILGVWGKNDIAPEEGKPSDVGVQYTAAGDTAQTKHFIHFTETEWTYKQIAFTTPASFSGCNFFTWKNGEDSNFYVDDVVLITAPSMAYPASE